MVNCKLQKDLKMSVFSILRDDERDFNLREKHEQKPIVMKKPGTSEQK